MFRQIFVSSIVIFVLASAHAKVKEPITSVEAAAKYLDLSAMYSNDRNESPGHFLIIPKFQIEGFTMKTSSGSTSNLASVGYFFKEMAGSDFISADDYDDNYATENNQYSCVQDGNHGNSKFDIHAFNTDNVDMTVSASSLSKSEAQEALFQFSKGYRYAFMGDIKLDIDDTEVGHPGGDFGGGFDWLIDDTEDFDSFPNDVIVNVCLDNVGDKKFDNAGKKALTKGKWVVDLYKNIYTWGAGGDYTRPTALYAEWDNKADHAAALAGDVTKKADRIYIRGVQFSRLKDPGVGTGVIHNAQSLLEYYQKAGVLTKKQFDDEMDLLDARSKGAKGGGGTTSPADQLVSCNLKSKFTSNQNGEDIQDIVVTVGNLVYDKVIKGERVKKWEKAKISFKYGSGVKDITRSGKDFVAYYVYDTSGELKQMRVENEAGSKDVEVYSVNNIGGISGTTDRKFFADFNGVFVSKKQSPRQANKCWFDKWQ